MRVLMLTNMYPHAADPSYGTFVFDQAAALRDSGVDVEVLFVDGRSTRWNYLLGYPRFWARLARRRFDLVHSHYVFSGLIARAQLHLPIVQSFHSPGSLVTYQRRLCRWLMTRVDAVIVTSDDHKARLGFAGARVIPCGVNLDLFRPMPRREARARLGWPLDRKVLLWLGEPRYEKRLDLVHATYERLRPLCPDLDLRLVSRTPHSEVPCFMNAADVMLFPSDLEGAPVVIKEAMACNLPIVATAVGDIPEVFEGVNGCLLSDQSPDRLAGQVQRLLESGRRSAGDAAIRHLDTATEARRIVAVYEEVLASRRERARPGAAGLPRGREARAGGLNPATAASESNRRSQRG